MHSFSKKIKLLRIQNGWNQEMVAKRLKISIPAYSKIETGVTDINLSRLQQIAQLFNVSVKQLLMKDGEDSQLINLDFERVNQKLVIRETEVIALQKQIINLFEELRQTKTA